MGEKNNGILEKTSPNSPFIIHHSSFIIHHPSFIIHHSSLIIHHSSLIISSISTSPKFLRSPFFQTAKLLRISSIIRGKNEGRREGAKRPTAGDEPREFTSRGEGGRVPPFIEKLRLFELSVEVVVEDVDHGDLRAFAGIAVFLGHCIEKKPHPLLDLGVVFVEIGSVELLDRATKIVVSDVRLENVLAGGLGELSVHLLELLCFGNLLLVDLDLAGKGRGCILRHGLLAKLGSLVVGCAVSHKVGFDDVNKISGNEEFLKIREWILERVTHVMGDRDEVVEDCFRDFFLVKGIHGMFDFLENLVVVKVGKVFQKVAGNLAAIVPMLVHEKIVQMPHRDRTLL